MDKRSLYDGLNQLESELRNTLTELVEMKHALHEIVEKNTTLEMENQRLREHLRELNQVAQAPAEFFCQGRQVRTSTASARPPSSTPYPLSPVTAVSPSPAPRSSPCTGR